MEERLGVRLLNRTTRSVSMTDAGLRLLERLRPAMTQIAAALETLNEERQRPFGRLRIRVSPMAAAAVVAPVWGRFLTAYPDVHLEIHAGQAARDDTARGFDAGIGPREWAAADMVTVRVTGPIKVAIVGAPHYFARRPPPVTPEDLVQHSCIQYRWEGDGPVFEWPLAKHGQTRRIAVEGRLTVNTPDLALRAALDGLGIAYAADAFAEPFLRSGQLISVLADWSPTIEGLYLYYLGRGQVPAALRALADMIRSAGVKPVKRSLKDPFASSEVGQT
jgi:DNA-binding transcriptional LysR family regulator